GDLQQRSTEIRILAEDARSLPGQGDGLLQAGLAPLRPGEPLRHPRVDLAEAVMHALRNPAALAHQRTPARDRPLQSGGRRLRPAPGARGLVEVELRVLAPVLF